MAPLVSVAIALGFVLIGAGLVAYGGLKLRPALRILRNDPVAVRDLEHTSGPVEVAGTARREESAVIAPFSGREALACRYTVEEYRQAGKHSHWETIDEGSGGVPFVVDDGTGRVPVDPGGADLRFTAHEVRVDAGEEPPASIGEYVAESDAVDPNDDTLDLKILELNVGNDQRFTEYRLDPGETVHVYGSVGRPEQAPSWGSDRVDAEIRHQPGTPFIISDSTERSTAWRLARGPLGQIAVGLLFLLVIAFFALPVL